MKSEFPFNQKEKNRFYREGVFLYLGCMCPSTISGLAVSLPSLSPLQVIESNLFDLLDFFSPHYFLFSSKLILQEFRIPIKKSDVLVLKRDGILDHDGCHKSFAEKIPERREFIKDTITEKMCPLQHLLLLSKAINEKQQNAIQLAIEYGFPPVNLVDFNRKTIVVGKKEIIGKWSSMISDQKGSVEEDFVRTLRSALKSLENEHRLLFEKMYSIAPHGDYSEYSLAPLFDLLLHMPMRELRRIPAQPRIGIASLRFEVVLEVEEERILDLVDALRRALFSDFFQVTVNEIEKRKMEEMEMQREEYTRLRISIILEAASDPVNLEDSTIVVSELFHLAIEEVLREFSAKSYWKFKKRRMPEFWLKNAGIVIEMSPSIASRIRKMIRDHFKFHLDPYQGIRTLQKSQDRFKILFNLYFSPTYDYVIDAKGESIFQDIEAEDLYTKIGIEHLMGKEFDQALKFFRRARKGLAQDFYEISSVRGPRKKARREFIKMKNDFLLDGLSSEEPPFLSKYTSESNPEKILEMQETTEKWIKITTRLRDIEILERQIRLQHLDEVEFAKNMAMLRGLHKETKVRFSKNFHNFIETIGTFYVNLLKEIEKESPESVKEWMNLKI